MIPRRPFASSNTDICCRLRGRKWQSLARFGPVLLLCLGSLSAAPGGPESLALPRTPYGVAYDGNSFWVTDIRERRIVRVSPGGGTGGSFLGRAKIYGLGFNPSDGHLYVGASRQLLRVNPITGARTDSVPVPVNRVAGVAFAGELWYLLEKGNGVIHVFDPKLQRTIRTIQTGRKELRDLEVRGPSLWASDGSTGIIYRFRLQDGSLSGSLRAPVDQLRGLCFREGQLWIINRDARALQRLSYVESEYALTSGDARYLVNAEVSFSLPPEPKGNIVVLQPTPSPSQQPSGVKALSPGWQRGFTTSGRAVFWQKASSLGAGTHTLKYAYRLTVRDVRWYVPSSYAAPAEALEETDAAAFTRASKEEFNNTQPFATIQKVLPGGGDHSDQRPATVELNTGTLEGGPGLGRGLLKLLETVGAQNVPARWTVSAQLDAKGLFQRFRVRAAAYLRGIGWIDLPATSVTEPRLFAHESSELELFSSPGINAEGISPVYKTNQPIGREKNLEALSSRMKVSISARR